MSLRNLYSEWLARDALSSTQLHVVLDYTLRHNVGSLLAVLLQRAGSFDQTHTDKIRTTTDPGMLSLWLKSRIFGDKDKEWFVHKADPALVVGVLDIWAEQNATIQEDFLLPLWERGDTQVRLGVLKNLRWHHSFSTSEMKKWFLQSRPFGLGPQEEKELIQELASRSGEWLWGAVRSSRDLALVTLCYEYMDTPRSNGAYTREAFGKSIQRALALKKPRQDLIAQAVFALFASLDKSSFDPAGSPEIRILQETLSLFPEDSETRNSLVQLAGGYDLTEKEAPPTPEALLALVQAGTLHSLALKHARGLHDNHDQDPLWQAVAACAALTPEEGAELVGGLHRYENSFVVRMVVQGRTPTWRRDLFLAIWHHRCDSQKHLGILTEGIPPAMLKKVVAGILESNVGYASELLKAGVARRVVLEVVPVKRLDSAGERTARAAIQLASATFQDDQAAWELFETFYADFPGTFVELLESVCNLNDNKNTLSY